MPLPLQIPEKADQIREQRAMTTWRLAIMMAALVALTAIMNAAGHHWAHSFALAYIGPPSALVLLILKAFTKLKKTVYDTTVAAAGLVLAMFLVTVGCSLTSGRVLVAGCLAAIIAQTWVLHRNLDDRIGHVRLFVIVAVNFAAAFWLIR
jgi:hypothetical protein